MRIRMFAVLAVLTAVALVPAEGQAESKKKNPDPLLSAKQTAALSQAQLNFSVLCGLNPQTARPSVCDRKEKYLKDIENEIVGDEQSGIGVANLLAETGSMADCYATDSNAKSMCEAKKKNGVAESAKEAAKSLIVKKLGASRPTARDRDIAEIARSLMKWTEMVSDPGGGQTATGRPLKAD